MKIFHFYTSCAICLVHVALGVSQLLQFTSNPFITNRYLPSVLNKQPCCKEAREPPSPVIMRRSEEPDDNTVTLLKRLLVSNENLLQSLKLHSSAVVEEFPARRNLAPSSPATVTTTTTEEPTRQDIPEDSTRASDQKAYACSILECESEDIQKGPVCACNFKTGNTVTFKNECDLKKHNCRFDTGFKTILEDICPWEFESRSGAEPEYNYGDPRYFKK